MSEFYFSRSDAQGLLEQLNGGRVEPPQPKTLFRVLFAPALSSGAIPAGTATNPGYGTAMLLDTETIEKVANISTSTITDGSAVFLRREQNSNVFIVDRFLAGNPCGAAECKRVVETIHVRQTISDRSINYIDEDRGHGIRTYPVFSAPVNRIIFNETLPVGYSFSEQLYHRWTLGCVNTTTRNTVVGGFCQPTPLQPVRSFTVTFNLPTAVSSSTIAGEFGLVGCTPVATHTMLAKTIAGSYKETQTFHWDDERYLVSPMQWKYKSTNVNVNLAPSSCPTVTQIETSFNNALNTLSATYPELVGATVTVTLTDLPSCSPIGTSVYTRLFRDRCNAKDISETTTETSYGFIFEASALNGNIRLDVWHHRATETVRTQTPCLSTFGCCPSGTWGAPNSTITNSGIGWVSLQQATITCNSPREFRQSYMAREFDDVHFLPVGNTPFLERRTLFEIEVEFAEETEPPLLELNGPDDPGIGYHDITYNCSDPFGAFSIDSLTGEVSIVSLSGIPVPTDIPLTINAASSGGASVTRTVKMRLRSSLSPDPDVLPESYVDLDLSPNELRSNPLPGTPVGIAWGANAGANKFELFNDAGGRFECEDDGTIVTAAGSSAAGFIDCHASEVQTVRPKFYDAFGAPVASPPTVAVAIKDRWSMNPIADTHADPRVIIPASTGSAPVIAKSEHPYLNLLPIDVRAIRLSIAGFTVTFDDQFVESPNNFREYSDWTFGDFTRRYSTSVGMDGFRTNASGLWRWKDNGILSPTCKGYRYSTNAGATSTFRENGGLTGIPMSPFLARFRRYITYTSQPAIADYGLDAGAEIALQERNGRWFLKSTSFGFSLWREINIQYAESLARSDEPFLTPTTSFLFSALHSIEVEVDAETLWDVHSIPATWVGSIDGNGNIVPTPTTLSLQLVSR